MIFFAKPITLSIAWTLCFRQCLPQAAHPIAGMLLSQSLQGRYRFRITIGIYWSSFPIIIPLPAYTENLTAQCNTTVLMIGFDPCIQMTRANTGYRHHESHLWPVALLGASCILFSWRYQAAGTLRSLRFHRPVSAHRPYILPCISVPSMTPLLSFIISLGCAVFLTIPNSVS